MKRCTGAVVAASLLAIVFLLHSGCGSETEVDATPKPIVNPRVASAEAILEYFNELNTAVPPRLRELRQLFYAESPKHSFQLEAYDAIVSLVELEIAATQAFNGLDDPDSLLSSLGKSTPARFIDRDDRRATAMYRTSEGTEERVYFVEFDRRWWISGFTLEYSQEFNEALRDGMKLLIDIGRAPEEWSVLRTTGDRVRGRLDRGEFTSRDEVLATLAHELQSHRR